MSDTKHKIIIAVDGFSSCGKSTFAKAIARELGYIFIDTGAMYRAMGYYFLQHGIKAEEEEKIKEVCDYISVALAYENGVQKVLLNGEDISDKIRQEEVGNMASNTSAQPAVRTKLVELQQALAAKSDVIMDGRDIGTVILPNADLKIFLTADVRDRARRRYEELRAKGMEKPFDEVLAEMEKRDEQDTQRAAAPLKAADDAVLLDTSGNTLEESIDEVCRLISEKMGRAI